MGEVNAEERLRRLARESGFDFLRSRKKEGPDNLGGFRLIEMQTGAVIAGPLFQLSLQDVARELQRRHVLGRR